MVWYGVKLVTGDSSKTTVFTPVTRCSVQATLSKEKDRGFRGGGGGEGGRGGLYRGGGDTVTTVLLIRGILAGRMATGLINKAKLKLIKHEHEMRGGGCRHR